jgi:hypothetical protein
LFVAPALVVVSPIKDNPPPEEKVEEEEVSSAPSRDTSWDMEVEEDASPH